MVLFAIGSDILKLRDHPIIYPLIRFVLSKSDFIFCTSGPIKKELLTMNVIDESRLKVISSLVAFDGYARYSGSKSYDVVSIGSLDSNKDQLSLLRACALLESVNVSIIGDGPLRDVLESESQKNRLHVKFLGNIPHDQVFQELQKSKILVHTAKSEGLPVSILEAVFFNLPIVVIGYPYVSDITKRYNFDFTIVETGSAKKLAETINTVLQNYENELCKAELNRDRLLSMMDSNSTEILETLEDFAN